MHTLNKENPHHKFWFVLISLFIIPISGVCVDIYVPSLPAISHFFSVDKSLSQLTITAYMLGIGIMQLFAGAISDSFGRKKPFLVAMALFIIITLYIPLSNDIYQLLFLRLIQGMLIAVVMVSIRSVIPDIFESHELKIMMNYMVMAWSIGPIIAPAIGGYLQQYFGWQANFYFLTGYSSLAFLMVLIYIPETSIHCHPFHITKILKRYSEILSHKDFLSGLFINGLLYSLVLLFAVVGPFLIQNILHYSAIQFGNIALLIGLAWFLGVMTNRFLVNIDLNIKSTICFWSMFVITSGMVLVATMITMNIYSIIIPIFIVIGLGGVLFPNYAARAISLFPTTTGSANALFGAFVFMLSGIGSAFGTFLKSTNQLPLAIAYLCVICICLSTHYLSIRVRQTESQVNVI